MSAWEKQARINARLLSLEKERGLLEREKSRAEPCECGHMRGAHMDDVAACHACRDCFSFARVKESL